MGSHYVAQPRLKSSAASVSVVARPIHMLQLGSFVPDRSQVQCLGITIFLPVAVASVVEVNNLVPPFFFPPFVL
jgi:hypothetical protein